jgi:hypothetical protein
MLQNESQATALAHLEILFQAASGDYSPKKGELEKRKLAVAAFIRKGDCVAGEDDRELARLVRQAVALPGVLNASVATA